MLNLNTSASATLCIRVISFSRYQKTISFEWCSNNDDKKSGNEKIEKLFTMDVFEVGTHTFYGNADITVVDTQPNTQTSRLCRNENSIVSSAISIKMTQENVNKYKSKEPTFATKTIPHTNI